MPAYPLPRPVYSCACGDHCWSPMTKGYVALVSAADKDELAERRWCAAMRGGIVYAQARINGEAQYLHRRLLPNAVEVDHRNHCGIDNRRENIRPCSRQENAANTRSRSSGSSIFKGVHYAGRSRRWVAQITTNGIKRHLGCFHTEAAAADAYHAAAKRYQGEFAL